MNALTEVEVEGSTRDEILYVCMYVHAATEKQSINESNNQPTNPLRSPHPPHPSACTYPSPPPPYIHSLRHPSASRLSEHSPRALLVRSPATPPPPPPAPAPAAAFCAYRLGSYKMELASMR
mmetsp:Transcript_22523/g.55532  ORF Transcript_22523/g.55532 Transcript_22523/m.55532 type:complete len:122 (-) Transcript_22523:1625-1990(-)